MNAVNFALSGRVTVITGAAGGIGRLGGGVMGAAGAAAAYGSEADAWASRTGMPPSVTTRAGRLHGENVNEAGMMASLTIRTGIASREADRW